MIDPPLVIISVKVVSMWIMAQARPWLPCILPGDVCGSYGPDNGLKVCVSARHSLTECGLHAGPVITQAGHVSQVTMLSPVTCQGRASNGRSLSRKTHAHAQEQKAKQRHKEYEKKREAKARDRQMYHLRHTRDYEALELPIGASRAEVKVAYRKLAKARRSPDS